MLVLLLINNGYSQDTLKMNESALEYPVTYDARDSIYMDVPKKQVHLYGKAHVKTPEMNMEAGYILIDLEKSEVLATYELDKDSNRVDLPKFSDGSEEMQASSIRYNFKSKKGYIQEVKIQQGENHLFMDVAKRHANEELHFKRGRFTTCNLDKPHYHFHLTKAVMVPNKRIVSGAMNLWIAGAPTPLAMPFSIIPQNNKERIRGLLFPQIIPTSSYGFGLQDLGYYLPINDNLQMSFYVSGFSSGTWGAKINTNYAKKYKFRGDLLLDFNQMRAGFPTKGASNKFQITWSHNKDQKSNPYWGFNSRVNFVSDNNNQNNLDPLNKDYFNTAMFSDINLRRFFPGKPVTMGMKIGLRQNTQSKNVSVNLPVIDINVTRVFPFKNLIKGREKWKRPFQQIGFTYGFQGTNRASFGDSLIADFDLNEIGKTFQNGIRQSMNLQTTIGLIKNTIKINPSAAYTNYINFQQVRQNYNPADSTVTPSEIDQFGMAHNLNFSASIATNVYTYYRFVGKSKPIIRHLMTPNISFRYTPELNAHVKSYSTYKDTIDYSTMQRSLYPVGIGRNQGVLSFGVMNNLQLKFRSEKDTIDGFKRIKLIDALSIQSSYDFFADSMNLRDFRANMRISPIQWLGINAGANFSPYDWIDSTGRVKKEYAYPTRNKLGRFTQFNVSTTITLTSKKSRELMEESVDIINNNWNEDYEYFILNPDRIINFNIPWKVSITHVIRFDRNQNKTTLNPDEWRKINTLSLNGDISFTKRWKLVANISMDLQTKKLINTRFSLKRNMHCWALSFDWIPIGGNKSFLLSIRNTSSLFQSVPLNFRRLPTFL